MGISPILALPHFIVMDREFITLKMAFFQHVRKEHVHKPR